MESTAGGARRRLRTGASLSIQLETVVPPLQKDTHVTDPPSFSNAGDEADIQPDHESKNSTPRWVKVFGIIAIVVFLLFVIQLISGGGRHGPGRHRVSDGGAAAHTPPADVREEGRALPEAGN